MTNVDGKPVPIPPKIVRIVLAAIALDDFTMLDELDTEERKFAAIYLRRLIAYAYEEG